MLSLAVSQGFTLNFMNMRDAGTGKVHPLSFLSSLLALMLERVLALMLADLTAEVHRLHNGGGVDTYAGVCCVCPLLPYVLCHRSIPCLTYLHRHRVHLLLLLLRS
eukprot:276454-Rhodomonas_salina.1